MQRISKELMREMFVGNVLRCVCDTPNEVESTYRSALKNRNELESELKERGCAYGVSKEWGQQGGVVTVTRLEDRPV